MRVPDIRNLSVAEKGQLAALVESVWKGESPVEWGTEKQPQKALQALDTFLLALVGAEIPLTEIYADLNDVVHSRILVARDKEQSTKSHQRVDVAAVARSIAVSVQTLLDSKRFPDDFYDSGSAGLVFDFTDSRSLDIECVPMLDQAVVDIRNAVTGDVLLNEQYPRPMAQVIVRALLLGRRRFVAPNDAALAEDALQNFDAWLSTILERVEEGARMSSVGTRYEQQVFSACFRELKLDVRATAPQFYGQARLQ